jgi:hypothetical protein
MLNWVCLIFFCQVHVRIIFWLSLSITLHFTHAWMLLCNMQKSTRLIVTASPSTRRLGTSWGGSSRTNSMAVEIQTCTSAPSVTGLSIATLTLSWWTLNPLAPPVLRWGRPSMFMPSWISSRRDWPASHPQHGHQDGWKTSSQGQAAKRQGSRQQVGEESPTAEGDEEGLKNVCLLNCVFVCCYFISNLFCW